MTTELQNHQLADLLSKLKTIEDNGGPRPEQYEKVLRIFDTIAELRCLSEHEDEIRAFHEATGSFSSLDTMHGFVIAQPHGYAGDFEIIDRIYRRHVSDHATHLAWDNFFHAGDAARAVLARKAYCVDLLLIYANSRQEGVEVLNVASGPCRDILDFKSLGTNAVHRTRIHCIDADQNAIEYGRQLLADYDEVTFSHANVLKLALSKQYNLVWSAGLFDYFSDRLFVRLIRQLWEHVLPGGELVVGNFCSRLNCVNYMEFGGWRLHYRDEDHLILLASKSNIKADAICVDKEENGFNLFLRIRKPLSEKTPVSPL